MTKHEVDNDFIWSTLDEQNQTRLIIAAIFKAANTVSKAIHDSSPVACEYYDLSDAMALQHADELQTTHRQNAADLE